MAQAPLFVTTSRSQWELHSPEEVSRIIARSIFGQPFRNFATKSPPGFLQAEVKLSLSFSLSLDCRAILPTDKCRNEVQKSSYPQAASCIADVTLLA